MKRYETKFYNKMKEGKVSNVTSANEIVPFLMKVFPSVQSVIDVGCGIGAWAHAFQGAGKEVIGVDGTWIDTSDLLINEQTFMRADLEKRVSLGRRFDLAISTEVGEHLSPERADSFVEDLTKLSDIVIYSAGITNQGGTHHINEQRQSYWKEKFENRGYICFDLIRPEFEKNPRVLYEYVQNMLVYVKCDKVDECEYLKKRKEIKFVTDIISPLQGIVKSSHSWRYIWHVQYLVIRASIHKVLRR